MTFIELYNRILKAEVEGNLDRELDSLGTYYYDPHHIDCLLHPEKCTPVWRLGDCSDCSDEDKELCAGRCLFEAITIDEKGNAAIDPDKCVGCAECLEKCRKNNLAERKDLIAALAAIKNADAPVYALVAPAFIGQFSKDVTPGKLRSAFKKLGFAGMVEVALFADILTLREALEFNRRVIHEEDFLLTSCCCPMWIALIRRIYKQYITHVPGSVSPMIACGRSIKKLEPGAITIFVGPCLAKKAEAREPDIRDAVDYVLTFDEVSQLFEVTGIDPAELDEDMRDHSSLGGRIYARTGGVSEAVSAAAERLSSGNSMPVRAIQANGIRECKALMQQLQEGKIRHNFIEGMGCVGGCVGGPRAIIDRELGRSNVDEYGKLAQFDTPIDNPYVIELLNRLGFEKVEDLLAEESMFTRDFS
ncbi:MAG: iron hydrogenase [Clostridiales bacterium]|nr:iron hydrogenase [Clostridiales bacterium]